MLKTNVQTSNAMVTIFGYGSLMNIQSKLRTMPSATQFRPATLPDYQRVFSLVSISSIRNGLANFETNEIAALAICPIIRSTPSDSASSKHCVHGILFDIPEDELEAYFDREHRYKLMSFFQK